VQWAARRHRHRSRSTRILRRHQSSASPFARPGVFRQGCPLSMHRIVGLSLIAAMSSAATFVSAGPKPGAPATQNEARAGDVTAILVDVVVRDRAGQPVTDLQQEEFQIIEDGTRQEIGSFTPIFKNSGAAAGVPASKPLASASRPARAAGSISPSSAAAVAAALDAPGEVLARVRSAHAGGADAGISRNARLCPVGKPLRTADGSLRRRPGPGAVSDVHASSRHVGSSRPPLLYGYVCCADGRTPARTSIKALLTRLF
jgi:hypothetical protein